MLGEDMGEGPEPRVGNAHLYKFTPRPEDAWDTTFVTSFP